MSDKQVRGKYTQEYKMEAVRQVKAGQSIAVTAKVLDILKASLSNWARLSAKGVLSGAGDKSVAVTRRHVGNNVLQRTSHHSSGIGFLTRLGSESADGSSITVLIG
jgi:transposase-like protein